MRVAVVVQRYGPDILGGAETHAALMAGILARHHDVEVLTTTAREYHEWRNVHPPGASKQDGVTVRRFPVARGREPSWYVLSRLLHDGFESNEFALLPSAIRAEHARRVRAWPDALQEAFIRRQGPHAPDLHAWLRRTPYDRVLFVTYLYPTTYDGLAAVPEGRALVVPTLHDEPPAYLPAFGRRLARATLLCSTRAEIRLLERLYPDETPAARLLGYGFEIPKRPRERGDAEPPFLLYAGRIDSHKGMGELVRWYETLLRAEPRPPRLVLIGTRVMDLPALPGLEVRGHVSEKEKWSLMSRALAFVHPSSYESLGIVVLEALAMGTPLIVNARSEVLVEHCRRGRCGFWVRDGAELVAAVRRLLAAPELRRTLGASGRAYVESSYALPAYERQLLVEFPR